MENTKKNNQLQEFLSEYAKGNVTLADDGAVEEIEQSILTITYKVLTSDIVQYVTFKQHENYTHGDDYNELSDVFNYDNVFSVTMTDGKVIEVEEKTNAKAGTNMTNLLNKTTTNIFLTDAKEFLAKNYSYNAIKNEEDATVYYEFELYTDYNDYLNEYTLKAAFEKYEDKEQLREYLYGYIFEAYQEGQWEEEDYYTNEIVKHVKEKYERENNSEMLEFLDEEDTKEIILGHGIFYVNVPAEEILSRSTIDLVVSLENETTEDVEFSHNNFYNGINTWIENITEMIEYGEIEENEVSIYNLLKSQGYTVNDFKTYCNSGINDKNDNFLNGIIEECENTTSDLNSLVTEIEVNLFDYLNNDFSIEVLPKGTVFTLVDFVYGAGSIGAIKTKQDITLKNYKHLVFMDGSKYCYGIKDIY